MCNFGQNSSSVSEQVASLILDLSFPLEPDISQNLNEWNYNGHKKFPIS